MEVVQYPHPALRYKSKPITQIDANLRSIVAEMFELMYSHRGIGLAANQVGLPWRLFIINPTGDSENKDDEFVFINPEISDRKGSEEAEEGCLSLPEVYGDVRRPEKIVVKAFGLDGQGFQMELEDLPARVVQHETDHVDGVMFFDRMTETAARELKPKLDDFESLFRKQQESGKYESDKELANELDRLAAQM
ncbi:UNVERIFIED_CONTAM: hypothetical protein GTU68_033677 [Idotea baltica]|nr:hypothetical protein [Idotea baltica]